MPGFLHYSSKICTRCGGQLIRYESGVDDKRELVLVRCPNCGAEANNFNVVSIEEIELTMPFREKLIRKFGLFRKIADWTKSDKQKEEERFNNGAALFVVNETDFPLYMFDDSIIQMTPAGYMHIGWPGRFVDRIDYGFFCPTFEQIENIILFQIFDINKKDRAQFVRYQDVISFIRYKVFKDHEWYSFFKSGEVFKYVNDEVVRTTPVKPVEIEYENGSQVRWSTKTFQSPVPMSIVGTNLKDAIVRICVVGSLVNNLGDLLQSFVQLTKDDVIQVQALDNADLAYENYKSARFS